MNHRANVRRLIKYLRATGERDVVAAVEWVTRYTAELRYAADRELGD